MDKQIKQKYREIDWEKLLRKDLGDSGRLDNAESIFSRIKLFFDNFIDNPILANFSQNAITDIQNELTSFMDFLNSNILTFSDVSQRDQKIEEIKTREQQINNSLGKYVSYFNIIDKKSIEEDLLRKEFENTKKEQNLELEKFKVEVEKITKAKKQILSELHNTKDASGLANKLLSDSKKINEATKRAEEWISKNEQAVDVMLSKNATNSAQKADEHITYKFEWVDVFSENWLTNKFPKLKKIKQPSFSGSFMWLISSFVFGGLALLFISYFISLKETLTVGDSILKISSIIVPSYFSVFSAQQYLNHRKLYESYKFKDISLQTMMMLSKQFPDDPESKNKVLTKSLDVIFSEPVLKEDVKYDKQLLNQIIQMLRK